MLPTALASDRPDANDLVELLLNAGVDVNHTSAGPNGPDAWAMELVILRPTQYRLLLRYGLDTDLLFLHSPLPDYVTYLRRQWSRLRGFVQRELYALYRLVRRTPMATVYFEKFLSMYQRYHPIDPDQLQEYYLLKGLKCNPIISINSSSTKH